MSKNKRNFDTNKTYFHCELLKCDLILYKLIFAKQFRKVKILDILNTLPKVLHLHFMKEII